MAKKKLLILVDWFVPGYQAGGPIKSCYNLCLALKEDYEISVITSDTDHGEKHPYSNIQSNVWNTTEVPGVRVFYINLKTFSKSSYVNLINEVNADFIYLNHLYSPFFVVYPLYLKWKNKITGEVIVCPRGALHSGALAEKQLKKKIYLKVFKMLKFHQLVKFHATNEIEANEIRHHFPNAEVFIANNLPDLYQSPIDLIEKKRGWLKMIYIARIAKIKNLHVALNALKHANGFIDFYIAGPIEDKVYDKQCKAIIQTLPRNVKVTHILELSPHKVKTEISLNHLYVLPSSGENFGHSIFEALQVGRPVLISDRTPWKHLNHLKAGWDLSLNEPEKFAQAVNEAVDWDQQTFNMYAQNAWNLAHEYIHKPDLKESYLNLFS